MNDRNRLYEEAIAAYGVSLSRLARGYEADPDRRGDLLQEIHIELWRSFELFDGRSSLRTWVYRVAHNVAASHLVRNRRMSARLVGLDAVEPREIVDGRPDMERSYSAARLLDLVHKLKPLDRQTFLLYLEGEPASSIAETTGLSPGNVSTKIHRIKKLLSQQYREGDDHARR